MKVFYNHVVKRKQKDNEPISTKIVLGRPKVQRVSSDTKWRQQQHVFSALPGRCHTHVDFVRVEISGRRIIYSDMVPELRLLLLDWSCG